jgi:transposase-like protein
MVERDLVAKALQEAQNNRSRAARLLGISRSQLYYKIQKHGRRDQAKTYGVSETRILEPIGTNAPGLHSSLTIRKLAGADEATPALPSPHAAVKRCRPRGRGSAMGAGQPGFRTWERLPQRQVGGVAHHPGATRPRGL